MGRSRRVDLDKITITDDLMFGTVFQDPRLCKRLVEVLLGMEIEKVELVERQEMLDAGPLARAGIVDLLVHDSSGNAYDVEMQNRADTDLAFRARRYLSLVDLSMLEPGQRFGEARGAIVVFVCTYDPFGRGWKRYNFPRTCMQDGESLGDATDIVVVNAEGTRGDFGPELDAFLGYLRDDSLIESDYVREVDDAVRSWRENPLWRRLRVLWSEKYRNEFADAARKGREDGFASGREEGLAAGRKAGLAAGREEGLAAGRKEGLAEGEQIGANRQLEQLSQLAAALEADGRASELTRVLQDATYKDALLAEYGISSPGENSARS